MGDNCDNVIECEKGLDEEKFGLVVKLIFDVFIYIYQMYYEYYNSFVDVVVFVIFKFNSMYDDFVFILLFKDDDKWVKILLDFVGLGIFIVVVQFFNNFLRIFFYFILCESLLNNVKDFIMGVIGIIMLIVKELLFLVKGIDWNF